MVEGVAKLRVPRILRWLVLVGTGAKIKLVSIQSDSDWIETELDFWMALRMALAMGGGCSGAGSCAHNYLLEMIFLAFGRVVVRVVVAIHKEKCFFFFRKLKQLPEQLPGRKPRNLPSSR